MASEESERDPPELTVAIDLYQQAPAQSIEQLKPIADAGNQRALIALTTFMMLQGQHEEALPYVEKASGQGFSAVAQMYTNDFLARRPELRALTPRWIGAALDGGWSVDYRTAVTNALQQDSPGLFSQLLDVVLQERPVAPRAQWEELIATASSDGQRLANAATEVAGQRDEAFRQMREAEDHISVRRTEVDQVIDELGAIVSKAGAHSLADAYAESAKHTERQTRMYTIASIVLGVASVAISFVALIRLKEGSSMQTAIVHAAYGLPLALFAAYVNKLASAHRREAWRLRHVELQIRTTNPFLALLDDERRKATLAALALRFFPGQDHIEAGKVQDGQALPVEVIDAIRVLLREQTPGTLATHSVSAPAPE